MPDSRLKFYGDLLECLVTYPHFREDFAFLVEKKYLEQSSPDKCKWLKSKTSLAEYFDWIGSDEKGERNVKGVAGGFWGPVSRAFNVDKDDLHKLAGDNSNPCKPPMSRAFINIKRDIIPYRKKLQRKRLDKAKIKAIKRLINMYETKLKNIRTVLKEIQIILNKNV